MQGIEVRMPGIQSQEFFNINNAHNKIKVKVKISYFEIPVLKVIDRMGSGQSQDVVSKLSDEDKYMI